MNKNSRLIPLMLGTALMTGCQSMNYTNGTDVLRKHGFIGNLEREIIENVCEDPDVIEAYRLNHLPEGKTNRDTSVKVDDYLSELVGEGNFDREECIEDTSYLYNTKSNVVGRILDYQFDKGNLPFTLLPGYGNTKELDQKIIMNYTTNWTPEFTKGMYSQMLENMGNKEISDNYSAAFRDDAIAAAILVGIATYNTSKAVSNIKNSSSGGGSIGSGGSSGNVGNVVQ